MLDYYFYTALMMAALYDRHLRRRTARWDELLALREQLREWADNYPPTFATSTRWSRPRSRASRGATLMRCSLYEQAIRSAHDHGFVQNEGLAYEVAARFYASARL